LGVGLGERDLVVSIMDTMT